MPFEEPIRRDLDMDHLLSEHLEHSAKVLNIMGEIMQYRHLTTAILACACNVAFAEATIADFESGLPSGWATSGSAWTVGGAMGITARILPPQGALFARSGAPGESSGPLAEQLVGTLTSKALTVSYDTVTWLATGWSGPANNGLSRFEILDQTFAVKATVSAPLTDRWVTQSVNLVSSGLSAGSTFYFRVVDGNPCDGYSWLAVDNLRFVTSPVPEVGTQSLLLSGGMFLLIALGRRKKK